MASLLASRPRPRWRRHLLPAPSSRLAFSSAAMLAAAPSSGALFAAGVLGRGHAGGGVIDWRSTRSYFAFLASFQAPSSRLALLGLAFSFSFSAAARGQAGGGIAGAVLGLLPVALLAAGDAGAGVLGRGHAGGGAAVDAVRDHGVDGVVVTNLLNRLAKYTLLLNFWC
jgi:hypothetical protein